MRWALAIIAASLVKAAEHRDDESDHEYNESVLFLGFIVIILLASCALYNIQPLPYDTAPQPDKVIRVQIVGADVSVHPHE